MQLRLALLAAAISITQVGSARADGEIQLRGAYYKEDATRVVQPMMDARLDVGQDGELRPHALADAITSASAAAGAAPGVAFTETRYEAGASYLHNVLRLFRVGGSVRFSDEPDYTSIFVGVRGIAELAQRNTVISVAGHLGSDELDNSGSQGGPSSRITEEMNSTLGSLSISQVLTPQLSASLTYDTAFIRGFQANMYRTVVAGGVVERERVPRKRARHAVYTGLRAFIPATRTALLPGYRYYRDSWGVISHTPEMRVVQQLARGLDVHGRYRYYRQSAAEFYKEIYDSNDPSIEPYLTNDAKLAGYHSHWFTVKLDVAFARFGIKGTWAKASADIAVTYVKTTNRFGDAITSQLALSFPFAY